LTLPSSLSGEGSSGCQNINKYPIESCCLMNLQNFLKDQNNLVKSRIVFLVFFRQAAAAA